MLPKLSRRFATLAPVKLPQLKWDLHELEPVLSKEALDLHYNKHHQNYVNEYNKNAEAFLNAEAHGDHNEALKQAKQLSFNLGGHFNHAFFWENLAPMNQAGGVLPSTSGAFGKDIINTFGSFEKLMMLLKDKGVKTHGSGWVWLARHPETKQLKITNTPNQETVSQKQLQPLLTIDVWEHAYYVNYQNKRGAYLDEIWKVINWKKVEERYNQLSK